MIATRSSTVKSGCFSGFMQDRHAHAVEDGEAAVHDVEVAVGDRVERAREDGERCRRRRFFIPVSLLPGPLPSRSSGSGRRRASVSCAMRAPIVSGSDALVEVLGHHHAALGEQALARRARAAARRGRCRRAGRGRRRRTRSPRRPAPRAPSRASCRNTCTSPPACASARAFSRAASTAAALLSTSTTRAAPRESASSPTPPLPAKASRKRQPGMRGARMSNSDCRTRAPVGRVASPAGRLQPPALARPADDARHRETIPQRQSERTPRAAR